MRDGNLATETPALNLVLAHIHRSRHSRFDAFLFQDLRATWTSNRLSIETCIVSDHIIFVCEPNETLFRFAFSRSASLAIVRNLDNHSGIVQVPAATIEASSGARSVQSRTRCVLKRSRPTHHLSHRRQAYQVQGREDREPLPPHKESAHNDC